MSVGAAEAEIARAKARVMADVSATLRELIPRLPPGEVASDWRGPTQRAFENALARQVDQLRVVAASTEVASDALYGRAAHGETS